jgi:hypothetical protein
MFCPCFWLIANCLPLKDWGQAQAHWQDLRLELHWGSPRTVAFSDLGSEKYGSHCWVENLFVKSQAGDSASGSDPYALDFVLLLRTAEDNYRSDRLQALLLLVLVTAMTPEILMTS